MAPGDWPGLRGQDAEQGGAMPSNERMLKILLWVCGLACASAGFPMLMPAQWMHAGHEWLGMGGFPVAPIAEYLARLVSGLFMLYGVLLIAMARDVRRYAPLITLQAFLLPASSVSSGAFGLACAMPAWWIAADVGSCVAFAAGVLLLQGLLRAEDRRKAMG